MGLTSDAIDSSRANIAEKTFVLPVQPGLNGRASYFTDVLFVMFGAASARRADGPPGEPVLRLKYALLAAVAVLSPALVQAQTAPAPPKAPAKDAPTAFIPQCGLAPGFITTAMTDKLNEEQKARILTQVPAGRMGEAASEVRVGHLFSVTTPNRRRHLVRSANAGATSR